MIREGRGNGYFFGSFFASINSIVILKLVDFFDKRNDENFYVLAKFLEYFILIFEVYILVFLFNRNGFFDYLILIFVGANLLYFFSHGYLIRWSESDDE